VEIQGTFNAQKFFDTLAMIISQKENVKVTVRVVEKGEGEQQREKATA